MSWMHKAKKQEEKALGNLLKLHKVHLAQVLNDDHILELE
jgi:hypothetical protein